MKRSEEDLPLLLSRAFEASTSGIIVGTSSSPRKPVVYVNPAVEDITGVSAEKMIGQDFWSVFGNEARTALRARFRKAFRESTARQVVLSTHHPDGRPLWVKISISPVRNLSGKETHYVAIVDDVTDRQLAEQKLSDLAVHDSLTGLPNRSVVNELLSQAISSHARRKKRLCVAFIDLDHFKVINDALGHACGDLLLQEVSGRLRQKLRSSDSIARLGGDEFIVMLSDVEDPSAAKTLAEKILGCFADPFNLNGHEVAVSASLGLTLYPDDAIRPGELLKNADAAMYQAKSQGRHTYRIFSARMNRGGDLWESPFVRQTVAVPLQVQSGPGRSKKESTSAAGPAAH